MNKNTKTAVVILVASVIFSLVFYFGFRTYFTANPLVVCGDDKYSEACLTQYAIDLNLNKSEFISCLRSNTFTDNINQDMQEASVLQLNSGPTIFLGEFVSETKFVGFYVSVTTYEELAQLTDNVLSMGISKAQEYNYKVITQKVNVNVQDYLKSQNLSAADYKKQWDDLQPSIAQYLDSFRLFSLTTTKEVVRGNPDSKYGFIYFADYGAELSGLFYTILLNNLNKDFIDSGRVSLVIKDLPISDEIANSKLLANAARCSGAQNKYFEYSDIIHNP